MKAREYQNDPAQVARMKADGALFASCECGRKDVLTYQRGDDLAHVRRLTYHNTPAGVGCKHGGDRL